MAHSHSHLHPHNVHARTPRKRPLAREPRHTTAPLSERHKCRRTWPLSLHAGTGHGLPKPTQPGHHEAEARGEADSTGILGGFKRRF